MRGRRHGIHGPYSEVIVLTNTKPLGVDKSGAVTGAPGGKGVYGSHHLANGQIGLTWDKGTANGLEIVSAVKNSDNLSRFLSDKSDRRFYLEVGTGVSSNAGGMSSKNIRSVGFRPEDVLEVAYSQSKAAVQAEVILGYDGFDTSKGMDLKPGEAATISLSLQGLPLAFYGRKDGKFEGTFSMQMPETDDCNDNCLDGACYDVVNGVIDEILNYQMVEGIPLSTFIDAFPVTDCFEDVCDYKTAAIYELQVCDRGDDAALGKVLGAIRNEGDGEKIINIARTAYNADSSTSTYEFLASEDLGATFSFGILTSNLVDPKCGAEDCAAQGGTYFAEGWYVDISWHETGQPGVSEEICDEFFNNLAKIAGGSVISDFPFDKGQFYSVDKCGALLSVEPSQANIDEAIAEFNSSYPNGWSVKLEEVVKYEDFCVLDPKPYTANLTSNCTIGRKLFYIDLKDDDCGNSRLEDVQSSFPDITVVEQAGGEILHYDVTVIEAPAPECYGVSDTDEITGQNGSFVVSWSVDNNGEICISEITTASGYSEVGEVFEGVGLGEGCGVVDIVVTVVGQAPANCRRRYHAWVESEIKCADPCYHQLYKFEAPGESLAADPSNASSTFEFTRWKAHQFKNTDTNCNCGIAFKSKDLELCPPKEIADQIGVINTQIKIQVSGGELLGTKIGYPYNLKPFDVTHVTRPFDGTGWGEDYMDAEKQTYDRYLSYLAGDNYAQRWFKNTTTKLEPCVQYDTFSVKLRSNKSSQSFSQRKEETFRYIFVVPKGSYNTFNEFFSFVTAGNPAANSLPDYGVIA